MKRYIVTDVTYTTPDVLTLTMRAKSARDVFEYTPGQYAAIGFRVHGRPTPMRCFSILSAPHNQGVLQFGIRIGGDYTQRLAHLKVGETVSVRGPFGNFVIDPQYDRSVVMLAGGIGVTPFLSMIRSATSRGSKIPLTLLYSCQNQENIPFLGDLLELERQNPNFNLQIFITSGDSTPMPGVKISRGRINGATLGSMVGNRLNGHTFFVCGPGGFITGMTDLLISKSVRPECIVSEAFSQKVADQSLNGSLSSTSKVYWLSTAATVVGITGIMMLDLMRAVPKIASAQAAQVSQDVSTAVVAATPDPTPIPTATPYTSSNAVVSTPAPTPTATPMVYQAPVVQTYRQPITSVS